MSGSGIEGFAGVDPTVLPEEGTFTKANRAKPAAPQIKALVGLLARLCRTHGISVRATTVFSHDENIHRRLGRVRRSLLVSFLQCIGGEYPRQAEFVDDRLGIHAG